MTQPVAIPLWLFVLILLFAAVTFASHFLFPSVRWFLRRRAERIVAQLNERLDRPIQPFKLLRRTDMIQRLIYDPEVMKAVAAQAHETGVREDVAFEQARRYAREIVPGFSASVYFGFATRAARWLSTLLYDVRVAGEEKLRTVPPEATVVFVMNHRSNMDYVLVTHVAAKSSALAYAVGEWARVWPLSRLIRATGGYFIRRRRRSALYRKVLARYVQMATGAGVAQAVFPEGGLSLDGRLAEPKLGLLSYLIADFDDARRDIVFVPVALNYDRVLEDTILQAAERSGRRRFRGSAPEAAAFTLRYLWRRATGRGYRMGLAGVAFGTPLSLRHDGNGHDPQDQAAAVAAELMARIRAVMPVLPVPVAADLLLARGGIAANAFATEVAAALDTYRAAGAAVFVPDSDPGAAALDILLRRGLVREAGGRIEPVPERAGLLGYYAASLQERRKEPRKAAEPAIAGT
jgi:glycerol-3-phosphate O-acyltransferase